MTTTSDDRRVDDALAVEWVAVGAKVRLRDKRLDDARSDYGWRRDETLARYDAARPLTQPYEDFFKHFREELHDPHPFRCTFAVEVHSGSDSDHGVHIGNVMYYNIDLSRREAELGVTIGDPAYWGHGYGTEAVALLVDHVFSTTSLTRIYLHTLDWNVRAQRSFISAGFRDCGRSRRGEYRFHRMEIWRPD